MGRLKEKRRFTLGKKIVLLTLLMCAIICAASVAVSYRSYSTNLRNSLQRMDDVEYRYESGQNILTLRKTI